MLCEYAIQTLDSMLENKDNREEVKEALVNKTQNVLILIKMICPRE